MKKKKSCSPQSDIIIQNGHSEKLCQSDTSTLPTLNGLKKDVGTKPKQNHSSSSNPVINEEQVLVSSSQLEQLQISQDLEATVEYAVYQNELQMPDIMKLIQKDLSEPYSIYTYRYFIHNWPHLCFMVSLFYSNLSIIKHFLF